MRASGYERYPGYRIDLLPQRGRVTALAGERILASSTRAILLEEQDHEPVVYFPAEDVVFEALTVVPRKTTFCPFKGEASYFALADRPAGPVAWTYLDPFPQVAAIGGYIAFYQERGITLAPDGH